MSTNPVSPEHSLEASLIELLIEGWRFSRLFTRVLQKLDAGEAGRFLTQGRFFERKMIEISESSGLKLVNVEGQEFDPGIAAVPLNIDDFNPEDRLIIDQMLEPIIMGPDGVRKSGTVMLKRIVG
jgi:hypothetical protein